MSPQIPMQRTLIGTLGEYELEQTLHAFGGSADTFVANVSKASDGGSIIRGQKVIMKMPRIHGHSTTLSFDESRKRLLTLTDRFYTEWLTYQYLRDLSCVAQVLDYGFTMEPLVYRTAPVPVLFIVQELIPGDSLDQYMASLQGCKRVEEFSGLPSASAWFKWSKSLVSILMQIHQRQVIHGDIWQQNIIVRDGQPVFIDFGQALFRDHALPRGGQNEGSWMPPEGAGSVAADIFSLGGVLLYLAEGQ